MEQLTLKDILYIVGAITAIVSFVSLVGKPYKTLKENLDKQEKTLDKQEKTVEAISQDLISQQKLLNSSLKVQLLVLEHMVYGNHTDNMKKQLQKLQETIIDVQ